MRTSEARFPAPQRQNERWGVLGSRKSSVRITQWSRSANHGQRGVWASPKQRKFTPARELLEAIEKSRVILELPNNWDDADNKSYQLETWERVRQFLLLHAALVWQRTGLIIPIPRIMPGPNGSIDLHWKTARRELLLNIPEEASSEVTYYGDDYGDDRTEGNIASGALHPGLFVWLTVTD